MAKHKKVVSVTPWLLKATPEVVKKLIRDTKSTILVGDSARLDLENVRLLVPEEIDVWQVITDYRGEREFFYTTKPETENEFYVPAYLSVVRTQHGGLNYSKNVGKLLEYPWFDTKISSFLFDRFQRLIGNAPLYGYEPNNPLIRAHPLLLS